MRVTKHVGEDDAAMIEVYAILAEMALVEM